MATSTETIKFIFQGDDQLSGKMSHITKALGALSLAALGAGKAIYSFGKEMAPLLDIQANFQSITEAAGIASNEMLVEMQGLTNGMIPAAELMETFNLAANLVGTETAVQLSGALGAVGKIALATGQDFSFLFESLVTGTGRESKLILDNLGVTKSVVEMKEEYAAALGLEVAELDKEQQSMAVATAVLDALGQKSSNLLDLSESNTAAFAQFDAMISNFKLTLASELMPQLLPMIEELMRLAVDVLPTLIPVIRLFTEMMNRTAEVISVCSQMIDQQLSPKVIELGNFLTGSFFKILDLWQKAMARIRGAIASVGAQIQKLKNKLAKLKLPAWLTPGSPTPLELGLRGINKELQRAGNSFNFSVAQPAPAQTPGGTDSAAVVTAINNLKDDMYRINQELIATHS